MLEMVMVWVAVSLLPEAVVIPLLPRSSTVMVTVSEVAAASPGVKLNPLSAVLISASNPLIVTVLLLSPPAVMATFKVLPSVTLPCVKPLVTATVTLTLPLSAPPSPPLI